MQIQIDSSPLFEVTKPVTILRHATFVIELSRLYLSCFRHSTNFCHFVALTSKCGVSVGGSERLLRVAISAAAGGATDPPRGYASTREQQRAQRRDIHRGRLSCLC